MQQNMINQEKLKEVILATGRSIYRRVVNIPESGKGDPADQYWRCIHDIREDELPIDIWSVQRREEGEKEKLWSYIEQAYEYL